MRAAFILSLDDTHYLADYDRNITFEENTYKADQSLAELADLSDSRQIPRYGIEINCHNKETTLYALLKEDTGPIRCQMHFLVYDAATSAWESQWSFRGILGEGQMQYFRYRGIIEHRLTWLLQNPRRRILNNAQQQKLYPGTPDIAEGQPGYKSPDMGCEFVHQIDDIRQRLNWRGWHEESA